MASKKQINCKKCGSFIFDTDGKCIACADEWASLPNNLKLEKEFDKIIIDVCSRKLGGRHIVANPRSGSYSLQRLMLCMQGSYTLGWNRLLADCEYIPDREKKAKQEGKQELSLLIYGLMEHVNNGTLNDVEDGCKLLNHPQQRGQRRCFCGQKRYTFKLPESGSVPRLEVKR